jgi:xanthine dehydrogenase accessory factor
MREVLDDVSQWRAAGKRVALATVVSVVGSAPRGVGAALAVSEDGEISGSVSGGCVEPAVIEEGLRAIRTGKPKLLTFGISEEQNVEQIGLSCGGEIRVFVERLEEERIAQVVEFIRAEEEFVRVAVIRTSGAAAPLLGSSFPLTHRGDDWVGLHSGFEHPAFDTDITMEHEVAVHALAALRHGESSAQVAHTDAGDVVEVFFAVYNPSPSLIVVGAGHITIPLTRLAKVLGYRVIVVDAREAFATRERLPEADELLIEWPDDALAQLPISNATAVAVLTHDDKFDVPALVAATRAGAGYIGAIGSRGTRERRNARLREAGLTDDEIAHIHGPIGLDIGAKTPEEIALAILAQVVSVRRGKDT